MKWYWVILIFIGVSFLIALVIAYTKNKTRDAETKPPVKTPAPTQPVNPENNGILDHR